MKASELREMIRKIVAEEVRNVLPTVLSEMYVRRLVAESAGRQHQVREAPVPRPQAQRRVPPAMPADRGSLRERLRAAAMEDDPSEFPPEPLRNDHMGIYQQSPIIKREGAVPSALDESFFEGTRPIPGGGSPSAGPVVLGESQQMFGEEGVPLDMLGINPGQLSAAARRPRRPEPEPSPDDPRMKALEARRRLLEVPVR